MKRDDEGNVIICNWELPSLNGKRRPTELDAKYLSRQLCSDPIVSCDLFLMRYDVLRIV